MRLEKMRVAAAVVVLLSVAHAQNFSPMTMTVNNGAGKDSMVVMGTAQGKTTMHSKNNVFQLTMNGNEVFSFTPLESNADNAFTEEVLGTMRISSFAANSISAEDFEARSEEYPNQPWLAAAMDLFHNGTDGWAIKSALLSEEGSDSEDLEVTSCGAYSSVLGGACKTSHHTIEKTYTNLPNHAEIQVTARVHFIDNWDDDTLWVKAGAPGTLETQPPQWQEEYTWCPQFFTFLCNAGIQVCGLDHYPDKLGRLVSFSMEHNTPDLTLQFGTNMNPKTPPCQASYGVSHVTVEVR